MPGPPRHPLLSAKLTEFTRGIHGAGARVLPQEQHEAEYEQQGPVVGSLMPPTPAHIGGLATCLPQGAGLFRLGLEQ